MSQSETNAPYLGAHISLISNSSIRYEGSLFAVDPKEASVTLESVRCFGTEDRPTEVHFPPSSEVYEYIVFSGKDIKDLNVIDLNVGKPAPQDPAIMAMGPPRQPQQQQQQQQSFGGYYPDPNSSRFDNSFDFPGGEEYQPVTLHQQASGGKNNQRRSNKPQPTPSDPSKPFDGPGTGGFLKRGKGKPDNEGTLSGEFDFQSSNARFDKDQYLSAVSKAKEAEEPAAESLEGLGAALERVVKIKPAYDKQKSFFDEISTDRDTPTQYNAQKEKVSNVETFGESAQSYRSFDYRRGRGRGGQRGGRPRNRNEGQNNRGNNPHPGNSHNNANNNNANNNNSSSSNSNNNNNNNNNNNASVNSSSSAAHGSGNEGGEKRGGGGGSRGSRGRGGSRGGQQAQVREVQQQQQAPPAQS